MAVIGLILAVFAGLFVVAPLLVVALGFLVDFFRGIAGQ